MRHAARALAGGRAERVRAAAQRACDRRCKRDAASLSLPPTPGQSMPEADPKTSQRRQKQLSRMLCRARM